MSDIDNKRYESICQSCDQILLENNANRVTVAIRWLHVLRWHPEYLKSYNYLFANFNKNKKFKFQFGRFFKYFLVTFKNLLRSILLNKYWNSSHSLPEKIDVLFISHLLKKNEVLQHKDFYFGSIADSLKSNGYSSSIVLIDHTSGFWGKSLSSWGQCNSNRLVLSKVLPFKEELKIYFAQFKEFFRLKSNKNNFSDFQREIIKEASFHALSPSTSSNLRIAHQIKTLLKQLETKLIITTYEGQAWERLVFSTARDISPNIKCAGYLNAGVFEFQHSLRRSLRKKYDPNIILTPGNISKVAIDGIYDNTSIEVLGSNNFQQLDSNQSVHVTKKTCLIAPEGILSECIVLFEYSILCAIQFPELNFIWRLHPRLDYSDVFKSNLKLEHIPKNIILSQNKLDKDLSSSTHILYRGSTVVVSSITHGLMPIYLKVKDELNIDPIYNCKHGRLVVEDVSDFKKAIDFNHSQYDKKYLEDFGKNFFLPFDSNVIECILKE